LKKIIIIFVVPLLCFLKLYSQDRVTALHYYQKADSIANSIQVNPALLEINCDSIDLSGKALTWSYLYDSLKITINTDSTICEPGTYWWTGMSAILSFVLDSDSAMNIAEKNGGINFRSNYPDYAISEGLGQDSACPYATWYIYYSAGGAYLSFNVDANNGRILSISDSYVKNESKRLSFILHQNYPNPFNGSTKINFSIPRDTFVKLTIYNILGEIVITLINEKLKVGPHSVLFNSNGLSNGLYFYKLETLELIQTKKMLIQN